LLPKDLPMKNLAKIRAAFILKKVSAIIKKLEAKNLEVNKYFDTNYSYYFSHVYAISLRLNCYLVAQFL